jgi:UDP-N-acetylmuramate dehydrogenase
VLGGDRDPDGIAISSKHVLALTNRGHGTTAQLLALAREIQDRVQATSGIRLEPEPVFVRT